MSVAEILPNLWLGNIICSRNSKFILDNAINVVVNCSKDIPFLTNKTKNYRIAVDDNLKQEEVSKFFDYLDKIIPIIHEHLMTNDNVLVHCYAGKQRSASIISAYLMKFSKMSLKQSIECIKTKRLVAFTPEVNFLRALTKYELILN
uniref:Tyrosine specific protein phosphatases domain-containing protein n=1 Tax=viral metagenome TaxID=1070528 RepID=A0A6C0IWM7_9ZZZZ